jgi:hypothetical protein
MTTLVNCVVFRVGDMEKEKDNCIFVIIGDSG